MKRTDGFLLKYIEGVPYLLPYGQRIVEHRRNLRLNETSAYLWEILPECASPHELHEKMTTHWEAETAEERDRLWQDLQGILAQFQAFGLIEPFREESGLLNSVSYYTLRTFGFGFRAHRIPCQLFLHRMQLRIAPRQNLIYGFTRLLLFRRHLLEVSCWYAIRNSRSYSKRMAM